MKIPQRYIPKILSRKDTQKQKRNINKSRRLYKKGVYYQRPLVKSFKSRRSNHLRNAMELYDVDNVKVSNELARKTKCTRKSLEKIVNKGRGAYYSSGSRPNQTAESWGIARLASSITGGNASIVDYHLLVEGCQPNSKALQLANELKKEREKEKEKK